MNVGKNAVFKLSEVDDNGWVSVSNLLLISEVVAEPEIAIAFSV